MNRDQFEARLRAQGYGEPYEVEFEPNRDGEMHSHEFSAMIMLTRGELTLEYENGPVTYRAGDWCELSAGTLHAERSGPEGATAIAGKR